MKKQILYYMVAYTEARRPVRRSLPCCVQRMMVTLTFVVAVGGFGFGIYFESRASWIC